MTTSKYKIELTEEEGEHLNLIRGASRSPA